jgi:type I restriction enzyme M protein
MEATINTDIRKITWSALSIFRGQVSNFRVILYLIHAYRKGLFEHYTPETKLDSFLDSTLCEKAATYPDYERRLFQVFLHDLSQLNYSRDRVQDFLDVLSRFDDNWYKENEVQLFDECLSSIVETESKAVGLYSQPEALTKFVAAVSGYDGNGTLYNPFAGSATYCTELAGPGRFVAQEKDQSAWAIGVLRLLAHGMNPSTYYCEDSILEWRGLSGSDEVSEMFDCIVATPPFNMKVGNLPTPWAFGDFTLGEDIFIWNALASIAISGIAIGVFAYNTAFRLGKSLELRQRYVDTDILDTVIALPAGVFPSTTISTLVLKFSRKKERAGFVRFVDGGSFSKRDRTRTQILFDDLLDAIKSEDERYVKYVSLDEIRQKEYNITPSRYFMVETPVPDGFERIKLEEIIDIVSGVAPRPDETKGKVVSVGTLSDTPFEYLLNISSLPEEDLGRGFRKITSPVLLLSKVRTLKPTFAQASEEEPIFINPNVIAARIKDGVKVFIPALAQAISTAEITQVGAYIPSINTATIRATEVTLPKGFSAQEAFYHNAEKEYKASIVKAFGLEELMKAQKMDFVSIIQRRQHDLNNILKKVRNACDVISLSLNEKGYESELIDEDSDITVAQAFDLVQQYLNSMSNVINHLADEETYAEPEVIDLIPRLKALAAQRHRNYTIRYSEDGYALCDVLQDDDVYHAFVKFGSVNLDRVFFNIIQNAEKHGFIDPSRTDYMIDIEISHDHKTSCFVIRFKNNGQPLPEGVDTRRYGRRAEPAGVTGGNGDGGAIVKTTVEHYGGSIELISEPEAWFPVCVELRIPHYDE